MEKNYPKFFQKKLKSYSALAGTVFATVNSASGQVVYTDINPDITANTDGASYTLDLNNDGIFDFTFNLSIYAGSSSSSGYNRVSITPLDSNQVAASTAGPYVYPFAMNTGDTVKSSLTWNIGLAQSMGSYFGSGYTYGNWAGVTDKYVGLKINVEGAIFYGWARLDVGATAESFTIKDYAYRNAVNQEIVIGAAPTGISRHIIPNNIGIYSDNQTIYINSKSSTEATVSVLTITGQKMHEQKMSSGSLNILLDQTAKGVYLVSVKQDGYVYTKKINLQ